MRTLLIGLFTLASLPALACEGEHEQQAWKSISVPELAAMLQQAGAVTVLDANSDKTRKQQGVIPGARLLTSSVKYDVAKELPAVKDATLVFYCANDKCTASHQAAGRALEAGYGKVFVLVEGIAGWKQSGQKTAAFNGDTGA